LDAVDAFYHDTPARTEVRALLKELVDLERLTNRVVQRIAGPRDLLGVRRSLEVVPRLRGVVEGMGARTSCPISLRLRSGQALTPSTSALRWRL